MTLDKENGPSEGEHRADGDSHVALEERAADLVNPRSGIANDYLNHFNEVFLLIENLPILLPEMLDELIAWTPVTYREYFQKSALPGASKAIEIYDALDEDFRNEFETIIKGVNAIALASVQVIANHRSPTGEIDPEQVSDFCENSARAMRSALNRAADLVNNGRGEVVETPQEMVERILTVAEAAHGGTAIPDIPASEMPAAEPAPAEPAQVEPAPAEPVMAVPPPAPEPPVVEVAKPEPIEAPKMTHPAAAKAEPAPVREAPPVAPAQEEARAKVQNSGVPSAGDESYFTVFAGGEAFGLSVLNAQTIFRINSITPIPMGPADIVGLVNLRGRIVTAVSLRRRLGLPAEQAANPLAIVIEHKGENFALIIDEVGDVISLDAGMRVPVPNHFDPARRRLMTDLYKVNNLLVPVLNISALFDFS